MAIATNGSQSHVMHNVSVDGDMFADFILNLPFEQGSVLIMDNHSMHDTELVQVAVAAKGYRVIFTPPYSPEFNPIEMIFGTVKNDFYTLRHRTNFSTVETTLERLIHQHATPTLVRKYFRHVWDRVQCLFEKAVQAEGETAAAMPSPDHDVSRRWKGVRASGNRGS
jgi:transposase